MHALDLTPPWESPLSFTRALVAISSLFAPELDARLPRSGTTLRRLLYHAADTSSTQWYFNNCRLRAMVPLAMRPLMPVGTTAN